jgi:hypothetical protein
MKLRSVGKRSMVIADFPFQVGAILIAGFGVVLWELGTCLASASVNWRNVAVLTAVGTVWFVFMGLTIKSSVFCFDLANRVLRWRKRGMFSRRRGSLPFDSITSAVVQTDKTGLRSAGSYRVTLMTTDGELPLVDSYGQTCGNAEMFAQLITVRNRSRDFRWFRACAASGRVAG